MYSNFWKIYYLNSDCYDIWLKWLWMYCPKTYKKMSPIFPVETKRLDIVKKATKIPYYNSLKPKRNWKECFLKTKAKISNFSWDTFCMLSIKPPWKFEKKSLLKVQKFTKKIDMKKNPINEWYGVMSFSPSVFPFWQKKILLPSKKILVP